MVMFHIYVKLLPGCICVSYTHILPRKNDLIREEEEDTMRYNQHGNDEDKHSSTHITPKIKPMYNL